VPGRLGQLAVPKTPGASFSNNCRQTDLATKIPIKKSELFNPNYIFRKFNYPTLSIEQKNLKNKKAKNNTKTQKNIKFK